MPEKQDTQSYDEIFNDDKLNIKSNVIDFAKIIEQEIYVESGNAKVYSISAEFGNGKTFFCDKLQQVLIKDKVKVGKLNIWEMDFYENPLIPILAEMNKLYSKKGKNLPSKIVSTIGNLSFKTLSTICETYARMKSNELLGVDAVEICKEKFLSETIYNNYNEYQKSLKELKKSLNNWASKQKGKPIVIIIDELDRCKPDYAIKTLEVLKHFFNIPGFVFVLAIDEEQLKNSVQTLFGTINYEGYKRKFINNTFLLPKLDKLVFANFLYDKSGIDIQIKKIQEENRELVFKINAYHIHCKQFVGEYTQFDVTKFNINETSEKIIKRYFAAYSELFNFTLRQMEQVFDRLVLFIKQIAIGYELFSPDLATFLVCLHEFDYEIYNKLRNKSNQLKFYPEKQLLVSDIDSYISDNKKNKINIVPNGINRDWAPIISPEFEGYSVFLIPLGDKKIIRDNVDRFFDFNDYDYLVENGVLDTNGVLVSSNKFDVDQFRKLYFIKMDFITRFK